jgi:hypothetical protein
MTRRRRNERCWSMGAHGRNSRGCPQSFINIPAHKRHRIEWTSDVQQTVWLAVHYGGKDG